MLIKVNHILIVDDDTRIRDLLSKYLMDNGFFVSTANNANNARQQLSEYVFDIIIMDLMMPGESGIELTVSLRKTMKTPILMLTAMGEVEERIAGLEAGADDYLSKPFEPRELLLRVEKILEKTKQQKHKSETIKFGNFEFNLQHAILKENNKDIMLTSKELELCKIFANNTNIILTREDLAKKCGGINERSVDVTVTRLRNKIERDPKNPRFLKTIWGKGYIFQTQ